VRDLLARAVEDLLADQLGEQQLARLVAVVLRRVEIWALGDQLAEPLDELGKTLAAASADREDLDDSIELGGLGENRDQLVRPGPIGRARSPPPR
jgi:hypothetical protein